MDRVPEVTGTDGNSWPALKKSPIETAAVWPKQTKQDFMIAQKHVRATKDLMSAASEILVTCGTTRITNKWHQMKHQ